MFQENVEEINQAQKETEIEAGDYAAEVVGVNVLAAKEGKSGAFIVKFAVSEGSFEGCEYGFFLTQSAKAAGVRAGFYRAIGYEVPSDGQVDEQEWIGLQAKITIENSGTEPRIKKVAMLPLVGDEDAPF
jgi:hypothetical protein